MPRPHVGMGGSAFVYGTLMAPEVVQTLIRRVPPMRSATLHGYTRYRVKGEVFPAIVPDPVPEAVVRGKVRPRAARVQHQLCQTRPIDGLCTPPMAAVVIRAVRGRAGDSGW